MAKNQCNRNNYTIISPTYQYANPLLQTKREQNRILQKKKNQHQPNKTFCRNREQAQSYTKPYSQYPSFTTYIYQILLSLLLEWLSFLAAGCSGFLILRGCGITNIYHTFTPHYVKERPTRQNGRSNED
jgi:hypothetical protein